VFIIWVDTKTKTEKTPASMAEALKEKGNTFFAEGKFKQAVVMYSKAIRMSPSDSHVYLSNRSAALLKCDRHHLALDDAEECIRLQPAWVKGYFRKIAALLSMEEYQKAYDTILQGLDIAPEDDFFLGKKKFLERSKKCRSATRKTETAKKEEPVKKEATTVEPEKSESISPLVASTGEEYEEIAQQMREKEDAVKYDEIKCSKFELEILRRMRLIAESTPASTPVEANAFIMLGVEKDGSGDSMEGRVRLEGACDSPSTHGDATRFLRQYGLDAKAHAMAIVMQKSRIAYPRVPPQLFSIHCAFISKS
jgi:tetratricopeptide (TPR) repeat protein